MIKKIIRFLPSIIWMLVIFYFSSRQTTGIGGDSYWFRFAILKSFHLIEYAILACLLLLAIRKKWLVVIFGYLYGLSDEFHQFFTPGRTSRLRDTMFDLVGILIGIFIFSYFSRFKFFKKFLPPQK